MPTLIEERDALLKNLRDIAGKAETESRDFTPEEMSDVKSRMGRITEIAADLAKAADSKAISDEVKEFLSASEAADLNGKAFTRSDAGNRRLKSLGELFVESQEFKSAMAPFGGKSVPQGSAFSSGPVHIPGGLKALIGTGIAGGDGVGNLIDPMRVPTVPITYPTLKMRDVVTVGTTESDAVTYARVLRAGVGGTQHGAAGVPEATTAEPVGSGTPAVTPAQAGVKPQSALAFQKETAPVVTVANWVPATKKALSDAGQLRTLIDAFLSVGLDQEFERQMLAGDSDNGEEFDGLLNTTGLQDQAFNTNILVTVRKAITKLKEYGTPNAVLVSPGTAERIDLLRISTGAFLGGGAFGAAATNLWRTPLVEIPSLADDTVLVGDFTTAVLWDREEASITATDSHADFFIRNLVAILAESRAAFGVLDPAKIAVAHVAGEDEIVPAGA